MVSYIMCILIESKLKTIGMINLEQVGAGKIGFKKSLNEDSLMDRALISSFETTRVKYKYRNFSRLYE